MHAKGKVHEPERLGEVFRAILERDDPILQSADDF